jgi:hypothetical protein
LPSLHGGPENLDLNRALQPNRLQPGATESLSNLIPVGDGVSAPVKNLDLLVRGATSSRADCRQKINIF